MFQLTGLRHSSDSSCPTYKADFHLIRTISYPAIIFEGLFFNLHDSSLSEKKQRHIICYINDEKSGQMKKNLPLGR